MKKFNFLSLILFIGFSFLTAAAQEQAQAAQPAKQPAEDSPARLFEQLGLTPEQIQQIRSINQEKKPLMRDAQNRLREANRNLDQAIYGDETNETEIQNRIKEVQMAHAEVIRIRSMNELAVRKILTPEQLTTFRELRQQVAQKIKNRVIQGKNPQVNKLNNPNKPNNQPEAQPHPLNNRLRPKN